MNEEIKKILIAFCEQNNWGTTDNDLLETLVELDRVYERKISKHRWYDGIFVVVNINGFLIGFNWYYITGDGSISDMDLHLDPDTICFVEQKERIEYYYEKIS